MPREALLVRTLVQLADTLVDDFDVVDLLTVLTDRCVEALEVLAAGVMLASPSGELRVVASSSERLRVLELFEVQSDEGPCVDAFRSGDQVVNRDMAGPRAPWPVFATRAADQGFASVHALPLRLRGTTIGALNLFCAQPTLAADDIVAGQALADIATIAIMQHRLVLDARTLNEQLGQALRSRIVIEQAKGRISEAARIDMDQAFDRLRRHARSHNRKLSELAGDVAAGAVDPALLGGLSEPPPG